MCSHIFPQSTKAYSPWPCPCAAEVPPSCPVTDNAMLPWSNWIVPSALGTKVKPASLHRPFDNPHDAENTARMGDKAKPSGVGAPTALLFEQVAQYRIIKIKLSISMIAVTAATESTKASLASW